MLGLSRKQVSLDVAVVLNYEKVWTQSAVVRVEQLWRWIQGRECPTMPLSLASSFSLVLVVLHALSSPLTLFLIAISCRTAGLGHGAIVCLSQHQGFRGPPLPQGTESVLLWHAHQYWRGGGFSDVRNKKANAVFLNIFSLKLNCKS